VGCQKSAAVPSGARTNLNAGGGTRPAGSTGNFFVVLLHFLALRVQLISSLGERFRNGQYSLASYLCALRLLTVLPLARCPAICKSGGTFLPCALWSWHHWHTVHHSFTGWCIVLHNWLTMSFAPVSVCELWRSHAEELLLMNCGSATSLPPTVSRCDNMTL